MFDIWMKSKGNGRMACKHHCASIHACVFAFVCIFVSAIPCCMHGHDIHVLQYKGNLSLSLSLLCEYKHLKSAITDQIVDDVCKEIAALKGMFPLQSLTSIITRNLKAPAAVYILLFLLSFPRGLQMNHTDIKGSLV